MEVYSVVLRCMRTRYATKIEKSVVTDAKGAYDLGDLPSLGGVFSRMLVAYQPGKCLGWTDDPVPETKPEWDNEERLAPRPLTALPTSKKSGRVLGPKGSPLVGVTVSLGFFGMDVYGQDALPEEVMDAVGIRTKFVTDKSGVYHMADVPVSTRVSVGAEKKGFADNRLTPGSTSNYDIKLVTAGRIEGRVVDAAGKPLAGVRISAYREQTDGGSATTDANGHYAIEDLVPGRWALQATAARHLFKTISATAEASRTTSAPTITELPTVTVAGHVIEADTGKPVQGVRVQINATNMISWIEEQDKHTGPDGAFSMDTAAGENWIHYDNIPFGYAVEEQDGPLNVPPGGIADLVVKIHKMDIGHVRVVDAQGKSVSGASVSTNGPVSGIFNQKPTMTDADGDVALPIALASEESDMTIWVYHKALNLTSVRTVSRDELLKKPLTITALPMVSLKVHVTLPSGKPAVGAQVSEGGSSVYYENGADVGPRTDTAGNVTLKCLTNGLTYNVRARLKGYYDLGKRPKFEAGKNMPKSLTIKLVASSRVQKGRVIDENGKPVAGAEVTAEGNGMSRLASTHTDSAGRFELRNLPDSSVRLDVCAHEKLYGNVFVSKASGSVVIQLGQMEDF